MTKNQNKTDLKFKFDPKIDYQIEAINSVVDIFEGNRSEGSDIAYIYNTDNEKIVDYKAVKNELSLSNKEILNNLKEVQERNNINQNLDKLKGNNFTVEMETGTGKTYIYLRTILELNKKYGMKKFIIVVPSIAIKEGVLKTLEITKEHFNKLYDNKIYNYYEYDSSNLTKLKQFSHSNNVEIMVMTIQSFRDEDRNVINQYNDKVEGQKPIELVQATNPILILDEPQNMESENSKDALEKLNPLFKLRYSATHKNYYNLVYQLTPVDAYNRGIVKQIEVLSVVEDDDYSNVFIRLKKIENGSRGLKAKLDIYKKLKNGIKRGTATVYNGDSLFDKSNGLEEYKDFIVNEIDMRYNHIKFNNGVKIDKGDVQGLDRKELMKIQIEKTVEEHFRKHHKLKQKGIKVLSLFFIDEVDNYVKKDGFIKKEFIKAYNRLKNSQEEWAKDYKNLDVAKVHTGYFAKKDDGEYYSSDHYMTKNKEAYDIIMKDKERLLSFEEPKQFVFSHSALREGWDNPNVFNICTLNESYSEMRKRQEIGRGVRIPVNQNGERNMGEDHILTVIANESYKNYVAKLQKEYDKDFGDNKDKPKPSNGRRRKTIKFKTKEEIKEPKWNEFKELWDRISKKTYYKISLNKGDFKNQCINLINEISVNEIKFRINRTKIESTESGYDSQVIGSGTQERNQKIIIKNFLKRITNETKLTRKTIIEVLTSVDNLNLLFKNPYEYINEVIKSINNAKQNLLIDGIKYYKSGDNYEMSLFEDLEGYEDNLTSVDNSVYDYVIHDSNAESRFAEKLDKSDQVKMFLKLPNWFKINTPIGNYNPDWGIVLESLDENKELIEKLYLVRETKSGDQDNLRAIEEKKIKYAEKHFDEVLDNYSDSNYKKINILENIFDIEDTLDIKK
ncbi:MAG: DEAD/DEAH box helicase family protein [Bacillota bacterium]